MGPGEIPLHLRNWLASFGDRGMLTLVKDGVKAKNALLMVPHHNLLLRVAACGQRPSPPCRSAMPHMPNRVGLWSIRAYRNPTSKALCSGCAIFMITTIYFLIHTTAEYLLYSKLVFLSRCRFARPPRRRPPYHTQPPPPRASASGVRPASQSPALVARWVGLGPRPYAAQTGDRKIPRPRLLGVSPRRRHRRCADSRQH